MAPRTVKRRRVVVDGSNIATEGRSTPSLAQLDAAIRSFLEEYPGFTTSDMTVVVDATFGHRIDPSERREFDQAIEHGEMVTPPAGAVGRGDGFILRIAEKSDALVLSNDSFQEFHAERPWLFDPGRLLGGKPVPGVGWVFTPRTPVRGPRSRSVTSQTRKALEAGSTSDVPTSRRASSARAADAAKGGRAGTTAEGAEGARGGRAARTTKVAKAAKVAKATKVDKAPKSAATTKTVKATTTTKGGKVTKTAKATKATKGGKGAGKRTDKATTAAKASKPAKAAKPMKAANVKKAGGSSKTLATTKAVGREKKATATSRQRPADPAAPSGASPTNDAVTFFNFVAEHPVGSSFEGTVTAFTSHGAHVDVDGMQGHVPLRGLGDPPPQRARQVLTKGERRTFSLVSLDPARRRAELTLAD